MDNHFEVIIVGGRCAGASLAIHLGRQQRKVLMLERVKFPSLPSVPSSPLLHPGAMELMDELGIAEEDYAHPDAKIVHFIMDAPGRFKAVMPTQRMKPARKYIYGLDRNKFDHAIWEHATRYPGVTACENFGVTDILQDPDGRVIGVVGKSPGGPLEKFTADLVVGADGRFSLVAQKVGAKVIEESQQYVSASFHAEWENVGDYSSDYPRPLNYCNLGNGYSLLSFPIGNGRYIIGNYMRTADANFGSQNLEANYLKLMQSTPLMWDRLKNARRVTPIVGVRRIENGYRQPYGPGWVLVGDALHYKSPIDGQGIYDALVETKHLALAIRHWKAGTIWEQAGAEYRQKAWEETHDMFQQTVERVRVELYSKMPPFVEKTIMRWVMTDPQFQATFLNYLSRAIPPKAMKFGPTPGPVLRGIWRDLTRRAA